MSLPRNAGFLLFVVLAALSSWWLYQQTREGLAPRDGSQRHDPDAFVEEVDLSTLDATGWLQHRLWAERMEHFPDDDSTALTHPYLELYRPGEPPWRIRAKTGWLSAGGAEVRLAGAVEILRAAAPGVRPAELYTERLTAFPDRDYAETDAAVTYRSVGLEVKAVGMRAYLDQGRVELLSRVRAVHQPQGSR